MNIWTKQAESVRGDGHSQAVVVFLLPHQDDEFGVFFSIEAAVSEGARVVCLYLTDGGYGGQSPDRRDKESRHVLQRLGVNEGDMHFVGTDEGYRDSFIYTRLEDALKSVSAILDDFNQDIKTLLIPAWEGGHRDHDAVHLIGAAYAAKAGLLDAARQFPLYRAASNTIGFALFNPLKENGEVEIQRISWAKRMKYLSLTFRYHSQWMVWIGLFPALLWFYLTRGIQQTQQISLPRTADSPHPGALLYEKYGRVSQSNFRNVAEPFIRTRILSQIAKLGELNEP